MSTNKKHCMFILFLLCFNTLYSQKRGTLSSATLQRREQGTTIINRPKLPIIIDTPGDYRLISHAKLDAVTSTTLIKITSSNVRLDLYGRSLSQKLPSTKNVTGIYIENNLSNVIIENATIDSLTGTGIIVGENCFNITLQNISLSKVYKGGISIQDNTDTVFIHNCSVSNATCSNQNNIGIELSKVTHAHIDYCSVSNLIAYEPYNIYCIFLKECTNCSIFHNATNGCRGKSIIGFAFNQCANCIMENNESNGNKATDGYATGLYVVNSISNTFNTYIALNNTGSINGYGIQVKGNSYFNTFESCTLGNNSSSGTGSGYGVDIKNGHSNQFHFISSFGNSGGSSTESEGVGIKLDSTTGIIIENSSLHYNNGGTGIGYGILLQNCQKCIVENNKIYYNQGVTDAYGIKEESLSSSYIASNIVFGSTNNYSLEFPVINTVQTVNFDAPRSVETSNRGNVEIT